MQDFESTRLDPLHYDLGYHIRMTNSSKYAFIMDALSAEAVMKVDGNYAIAKERFFPMRYSVALQKNSAYTSEMSHM